MVFYYNHEHVGPSIMMSREASTVWWCVAAILLVSSAPGWARPQADSGPEPWQPVSSGHRVNRYTTAITQNIPTSEAVVNNALDIKYTKINNLVNQSNLFKNYESCFNIFGNKFPKPNVTYNVFNLLKCLRLRILFLNKIHKYNSDAFKDRIISNRNNTLKLLNNNILRNFMVHKTKYDYNTDGIVGFRKNLTSELLNNLIINYYNETEHNESSHDRRTKETTKQKTKIDSVRSGPKKQRSMPLLNNQIRSKRNTNSKERSLRLSSRRYDSSDEKWLPVQLSSNSNEAVDLDENNVNLLNEDLVGNFVSNSLPDLNNQGAQIMEANSKEQHHYNIVRPTDSGESLDALILAHTQKPLHDHKPWSKPRPSVILVEDVPDEYLPKPPPGYTHSPPEDHQYVNTELEPPAPTYQYPRPPPSPEPPPNPEYHHPSEEPSPEPHTRPSYQYPSAEPSPEPHTRPSYHYPSAEPSPEPNVRPSYHYPSHDPPKKPTYHYPSSEPSAEPPKRPTYHYPSSEPSAEPPKRPTYHYPSSEPSAEPPKRPTYHYPSAEPPSRPVYHYLSSEPSPEPSRPTYHYPSAEPSSKPVYHYPSSKPQSKPTYHFKPTSNPTYHYPRPEPEPEYHQDPEPEPEYHQDPEPEPEYHTDPSTEPFPETFDDLQPFPPGSNPPEGTPSPPFIILASPTPVSSSPFNPITITSGSPPPTIVIFSDTIVPAVDTPTAEDTPVNPIAQPPLDDPVDSPPASSGGSPIVPPGLPTFLPNPGSVGTLIGSGGQGGSGGSGGNGCPHVQLFNSQLITNSAKNKECTDMTINLNNHDGGDPSDPTGGVQFDGIPDTSTVVTPTKKPKPSDSMSILEYVSSFFASLTLFNPISISFWSMLFAPVSILLASGLGVAALVLPWAFPRFWFGRNFRSRRKIDRWNRGTGFVNYRPRFSEDALRFERKLESGFDFEKFLRQLKVS